MATNWVDEILSGATSSGSKTLSLTTGNVMSVANSNSESLFTVTSDTTNGGFTSILGIENQEAVLFLGADNADDAADVWEIQADTSGNFKIGNRTGGTGTPARGNTITNAITIDTNRNISVGVDDTGYDVKFFGATSGQYLLWDESADELVLAGDTKLSFHDAAGGENIVASGDGHLEINAGTTLDITATTVDLNGNLDVSGNITSSSGAISFGDENLSTTGWVTVGVASRSGTEAIRVHGGAPTILLTSEIANEGGEFKLMGTTGGGGTDYSSYYGFMDMYQKQLRLVYETAGANLDPEAVFLTTPSGTSGNEEGVQTTIMSLGNDPIVLKGSVTNSSTIDQVNIGEGGDKDQMLVFNNSGTDRYMGIDADQSDEFRIGTGSTMGSDISVKIDTSHNVTIAGDLTVDGGDITVNNMTSSGFIKCVGTENNAAAIELWADEGDDNDDKWQIESATDNTLYFYNYTGGSWASKFNVTKDGIATTANDHYMGGVLYIGGADSDGTDRSMVFSHGTAKVIMGIDDSADAFVINADNSGAYDGTLADNSFTIDTSSNVTIAGALTIGGNLTMANADVISNASDDAIRLQSNDTAMNLQVASSASDTDTWITFFETTNAKWYIGNDASGGASDDLFTIGTGNTVATNAMLTLNTSGDLTVAGDLTVTGGDIDLSGEASTVNLIDNNGTAIQFGSSGSTDTVTISTADGQETLIVDADRAQANVEQGALQLQGTASMTGNATESVLGGLYFKAPTFVCADSGSHTVTRHSYIKLDDFNTTDGSGSMAVTNAFLLEFENNIGAANSCTTNADKTGEAKSGTIKVNVNGTLYHIQLYAD